MEKQQEEILLKVRSSRSIIAAGFHLYVNKFIAMLKAQWVHLLDTTAVYAAVIMLTVYGLYFFVPLAAVAVLLEMVLWLMTARWLTQRPVRQLLQAACRHWFRLVLVVVAGIVLLLPLCLLAALPAIVLALAEWNSQDGILMGDAPSMPSYVLYLSAVTWGFAAFTGLCLRLLIVYIAYFSWGSAEARQRERAQQLSTLSSSIPYKA